jgi:Transglutaminase-like superfamily
VRSPVIPARQSRLTPVEKARLASELLGLYARARWRLRRDDLPTALESLRRDLDGAPAPTAADALFVGRVLGSITTRSLSALPADGRCLVRSLVLTGLLSRRGIESKLVLAVHPGEELAAHAWVEYDGSALLEPGRPPLERLTEL